VFAGDAGKSRLRGVWTGLRLAKSGEQSGSRLKQLTLRRVSATVTLATTEEPIGTWLGSTAGMVAADAIAIGAILGTRLPERAIKLFSAAAFVAFGALLVAGGLGIA
jgi:hypothetical protein